MSTWQKSQTFGESLRYALAGVRAVWQGEPNLKRQIGVGVVVLVVALALGLSMWQVMLLLVVSGIVLVLEMINSAVELLLDVLHPEYDNRLKIVKDILAAAVLTMSMVAAIVGMCLLVLPLIALVA